jgi:flagellar hook-associated protein 1
MDKRDAAINDLSKYVDIHVTTDQSNQTNIFTNSGIQLVGQGYASTFEYTSQGALSATSLYNGDPTKSGVGALNIKLPNGARIDAANGVISSGQIAADLKLRDQTLVQAQAQVDQMAATLSSSLSDQTTAGTAITVPAAGFSVSTSNMSPGNTIDVSYTNPTTGAKQQISIVNVTDPTALPLKNGASANPLLIGVDLSGGVTPAVLSTLNSALAASGMQVSGSGSTLNVYTAGSTINSASSATTIQSLTSGSAQLPLFTDGNSLYTGQITGSGSQMTGLAGRISVNPAVLANPSALSVYSTSPATAAGDNTRSDFLYTQLTNATFSYSPQTGLGSAAQPFQGTLSNYLQSFISQQGNASTLATQLQQGQSVVVSTLQQKFNSTSAVNIDTEMSNLIQVQNTYAANAHLMSVVQTMMQDLMQVQL